MLDRDGPDVENRLEWFCRQDGIDLLAENVDSDALDIQIHVIRIAGTPEEKPEIAAAFQGPFLFVQFPGEVVQENQMENLNRLFEIERFHLFAPNI
jgi:hypothetical protein